ncbi:MAG: glycerol kinase, partial [Bdellovibrionales bacterium]|nr:glycerol kinase [Bdellovibrionales bacterium]
ELLNIFNIPVDTLPKIEDSFGEFGVTSGLSFLPDGIPITGVLGDQQSALFGQAGVNKGDMKCTYGTGAFMLVNSGEDIINSKNGLLSTVAYMENGKCVYALEGSSYIAGAAVQWLRDNLKIIETAPQVEALANEVTDLNEMKNILFLPFFTGIGSPHWVAEANAAILGITRGTSNSHLARACLEGIALSINDLINAIKIDTGLEINELKVDGGAVQNNLLMEIQADLSQLIIQRPQIIETTAYGATLAAAVGLKLITISEIKNLWKQDAEFINSNDNSKYFQSKERLWQESIKKLFLQT